MGKSYRHGVSLFQMTMIIVIIVMEIVIVIVVVTVTGNEKNQGTDNTVANI